MTENSTKSFENMPHAAYLNLFPWDCLYKLFLAQQFTVSSGPWSPAECCLIYTYL